MTLGRVVLRLGRTLIAVGVLVLLFVAYQLWGTGLSESHSQHSLRNQLAGRLRNGPTAVTPPAKTGGVTPAPVSSEPAPPTREPPEGSAVGLIRIPKIGVDKAIVEGTATADLREGPGHYSDTPLPGQPGNSAVAGHRTTYGAPFYNVNELGAGDQLFVTTPQGTFRYDVTRTFDVSPSDLSVIATARTNELTLTTCTPRFSAAERLIVQAVLVGPPAPAPPGPPAAIRTRSTLAGDTGAWIPVFGWGLGLVGVALGVWLFARNRRRRFSIYVLGTPAVLVLLFMFFVSVSKLLPASI